MKDIYQQLAQKLDQLPNGYPSTDSGVELRILKWIFSPQEAEIALRMSPVPEPVEAVAEHLDKGVPETQEILDNMVANGQIGSFKTSGQQAYALFPFLPGIYEWQFHRKDKKTMEMQEYTALFEEYFPSLLKPLGHYEPATARVVPVSTEITADLKVHRLEDIRRMIDGAKSFQLLECICRKERALEGHPCNHTLEICLTFTNEESSFDKYPQGKIISKEEAHKVIAKAEEEGLVHCTYNADDPQFFFVCNCCPCCCAILRGAKEFKAPYILANSNFVASIDPDSCASCGDCAEGRCPMEAILEDDGEYRVIADRCIGCGVCTSTCPTEAITLIRRPEDEQDSPPTSLLDWSIQRAASRGIELKTD